jgi:carbamoyl-phosphate synthase small subunit
MNATPPRTATTSRGDGAAADGPTGVLVLADGTAYLGHGAGAAGSAAGELCFNTAMTGYQEILTDPSYAQQVICFTFPHIGNVGTTPEDEESSSPRARTAARGVVLRAPITPPANWRSREPLDAWLAARGIVAVTGIDTRAVTRRIREYGMPHCVVAHDPEGRFDIAALAAQARAWPGLEGADLAKGVTSEAAFDFAETDWTWPAGAGVVTAPRFRVVVIDYGVKANILRRLGAVGATAKVVPAETPAHEILALKPDGVLLANGPGDPAATGAYAFDQIRAIAQSGTPLFGICLGHQMLAAALGAKTVKMPQGHHGANHPVKDLATGAVQIVSMNHGFAVDRASLPADLEETHVSLFDGTNCGVRAKGRPVFSVQHHPEASPGPHDSFALFEQFAALMADRLSHGADAGAGAGASRAASPTPA